MVAQLFLLAQATIVSFLFAAAFRWEGSVVVRIGMVVIGSALMLGILVFRWRVAQILSKTHAASQQDAPLPSSDVVSRAQASEVATRGLGVGGTAFTIAYIFVVAGFTFIVAMVWPE